MVAFDGADGIRFRGQRMMRMFQAHNGAFVHGLRPDGLGDRVNAEREEQKTKKCGE
jgi:hypothetical protein